MGPRLVAKKEVTLPPVSLDLDQMGLMCADTISIVLPGIAPKRGLLLEFLDALVAQALGRLDTVRVRTCQRS